MNTRRSFFSSLLALGTLGIIKTEAKTPTQKTKGFMLYRLNVGTMPPTSVDAYTDEIQASFAKTYSDWIVVVIPVREQDTELQIIPINGDSKGLVVTLNIGLRPLYKEKAYACRIKDKVQKMVNNPDWIVIVLPVRHQNSKIEIMMLDGSLPKAISPHKA